MHELHVVPVPSRRLFSAAKAAAYLGISVTVLKQDTDRGLIPCFMFHDRRTYRLEDLDTIIRELPKWQAHQTREGLRKESTS